MTVLTASALRCAVRVACSLSSLGDAEHDEVAPARSSSVDISTYAPAAYRCILQIPSTCAKTARRPGLDADRLGRCQRLIHVGHAQLFATIRTSSHIIRWLALALAHRQCY